MPPTCIYTATCISRGVPTLPHIQGFRPFPRSSFWHSGWRADKDNKLSSRGQDGPELAAHRARCTLSSGPDDLDHPNIERPYEALYWTGGGRGRMSPQGEDPNTKDQQKQVNLQRGGPRDLKQRSPTFRPHGPPAGDRGPNGCFPVTELSASLVGRTRLVLLGRLWLR